MNPLASKDDTVQNFKNTAQDFRSNTSAAINEAKSDLRDTVSQAGSKVSSFIDSASDEVSHTTNTVTKEIRNNPVQSSLIALGVGFILATLFSR